MRILVVASEAVPFIKTGGLGDVVGALPKALAKQNHDVKVFVPRYRSLNTGYLQIKKLNGYSEIKIGDRKHSLSVEYVRENRISLEYYFVKNAHFFDRSELYCDDDDGKDYSEVTVWSVEVMNSGEDDRAASHSLVRYGLLSALIGLFIILVLVICYVPGEKGKRE